MKADVLRAQVISVEMGVDPRRLDGAVSQELLHHAKVAAPFQEVGRARMPQCIRRDGTIETRGPAVALEQLPVSHPREAPAETCQEHRALAAVPQEAGAA